MPFQGKLARGHESLPRQICRDTVDNSATTAAYEFLPVYCVDLRLYNRIWKLFITCSFAS